MSLFRAITRTMLKATLVRGRFFTDAEDASKPEVVVINQALAQKYFPAEDPIGQRIADYEGGFSLTVRTRQDAGAMLPLLVSTLASDRPRSRRIP
jgi:hypothetical protein